VTLDAAGRLRVAPVAELAALRAELLHDGPVARPGVVPGCAGAALELVVELGPVPGGRAALVVGCDASGEGGLAVEADWAAGTVAGHDLGPLRTTEPLRLHVYVDASVVEAFTLGRVVTLRDYDGLADPRVAVRAEAGAGGAPAPPACVTAWRLAPPPGSHPAGTPGVVTL
jgi:hypothetical protein